MKTVSILIAVMFAGLAALLVVAGYRWRGESGLTRERLLSAARSPVAVVNLQTTDSLPAPVKRYLRAVLRDGAPMIRSVRLREEGMFLTRPERNGWGAFSATHDIVPVPPGFLWDARISMGPGIKVNVRDSFVGGAGSMFGSVLGLFRVVSMEGTPEMSVASMQRYLAEAVWAPTALLPDAGMQWTAIDDSSARAELTVGTVSTALDFFFDGRTGLVTRVYTSARGRAVNGTIIPTPWQGRWSTWVEHAGMRMPAVGEVEWLLPEGPQPYWRGRLTEYTVEFAGK